VILDALGGPYSAQAVDALAPGGRLVVYGTSAGEVVQFNMRTMYRKGLTISGYTGLLEPPAQSAGVLNGLLGMVAAGSLRVGVELLGIDRAAEAHRRIVDRQVVGKLVIDVRS
jgi:NADPH:quinone reductase